MERVLERKSELAALEEAVQGLVTGLGGLVLVGGEAGIGKTTLVRALRARVDGDVGFLVGACESLSVPVPLAPLRELALAAGAADPLEAEGGDLLLLARRVLAALVSRAPTVAVIEDVHWADATTLDVLRLLARRVGEAPVLLVLTYRDDELAANPGLTRLLGDWATAQAVRRLTLRPLSEVAVRALAEPAGFDAARLAQITGGNPFLVVETIVAGQELPATVRDAALARASRLDPMAREVVAAAAVIGRRVPPALLEAVAPCAAAGVEAALAHGVLVAEGEVLGFRHELMRKAIESTLSPPRRAALHGRVVAALTAQATRADHARLAHHAELAGLPEVAGRYAALAADEAERMGALRETSLQAERALRLYTGLEGRERVDLLLRHSHAANFSSIRLDDAVGPAKEAIAIAERLGDPVRRGRGEIALSFALWSLGRVTEARQAAQRAVAVLTTAGDPEVLVRAQATEIRMEATAFDPAMAIELGPLALALAEKAGLEESRLDVIISVGLAHGHRGEADCLSHLADAAAVASSAGYTIQAVRAYVNLAYAAATLRHHEVLERAADEALALFDEYQTLIPAKAIELYRAWSRLDRGRFAEARATASRRGAAPATLSPLAKVIEGLVAARSGDADGVRLLEAAWTEVSEVPVSSQHGMIRVAIAEAQWLAGERPRALRTVVTAHGESATMRFARSGGELALWAHRLGIEIAPPAGAPAPIALEIAGDWRRAVRAWQELEAPYEAALAAIRGDDRTARAAVGALHQLGASAAARAFARERAATGARVPRGPRRSTRAHPAGLTRREEQILACVATGATNATIAATLHLSERTVAHHVSAILRKLGVGSRHAAIQLARAEGLLTER